MDLLEAVLNELDSYHPKYLDMRITKANVLLAGSLDDGDKQKVIYANETTFSGSVNVVLAMKRDENKKHNAGLCSRHHELTKSFLEKQSALKEYLIKLGFETCKLKCIG